MNWLRFIYIVRTSYLSRIPREGANLYPRSATLVADTSTTSSFDIKFHRLNINILNAIVQMINNNIIYTSEYDEVIYRIAYNRQYLDAPATTSG